MSAARLPLRRRGTAIRRRRPSLLLVLARALTLSAAVVAAPVACLWWLLTAPRFAVSDIDLEATERVEPAWLERATAGTRGRNILRLPLGELRQRLEAHPWIERVEIRRQLPDRLRIAVVEHRPAAVLEHDGRQVYLTRDGRPIAPVEGGGEELLVVRAAGAAPTPDSLAGALGLAGRLAAADFDRPLAPAAMTVLGQRELRLEAASLPFPVLVREGTAIEQLRWLDSLLPEIQSRYPGLARADLRFDRRIVLQLDPEAASAGPSAPSARTAAEASRREPLEG